MNYTSDRFICSIRAKWSNLIDNANCKLCVCASHHSLYIIWKLPSQFYTFHYHFDRERVCVRFFSSSPNRVTAPIWDFVIKHRNRSPHHLFVCLLCLRLVGLITWSPNTRTLIANAHRPQSKVCFFVIRTLTHQAASWASLEREWFIDSMLCNVI